MRLVLANLQVANCDVSTIVVDTPAVLLDAIDAVGIANGIVDIHHADTIVGVDGNIIHVITWTSKVISINAFNESLATIAFFLKVNLATAIALWIDNHCVVLLEGCVSFCISLCATNQ